MAAGKPRHHRHLPNPRLVKIHRNYSVEEAADLLGVHKNTVRNYLRDGLPALNERRPLLILGCELSDFLTKRRRANKRPCGLGEIYCVRCREPQRPVADTIRYVPATLGAGNLAGICPRCDAPIFRLISTARLEREFSNLGIPLPEAQEHIVESDQPSVNCDFRQDAPDHD
jgi:hypothetical protein